MLRSVGAELRASEPHIAADLDKLPNGHRLYGGTERENAAIGYEVLRRFAASQATDPQGYGYMKYVGMGNLGQTLDLFRESYLEPFYEFIDEQVEDRNIILAELIRFKHTTEWFRREDLWRRWTNNSARGEWQLTLALCEFLYKQGIEFSIEPTSASGEADLVSIQQTKDPLVADVKVFDPTSSRGSAYIKKGFHQVYRYLHDYNKPVGYLIVFRVTDKQIHISTSEEPVDIPRVSVADKTIFVIQIDIFPHKEPASGRPVSDIEEISEDELRAGIQ